MIHEGFGGTQRPARFMVCSENKPPFITVVLCVISVECLFHPIKWVAVGWAGRFLRVIGYCGRVVISHVLYSLLRIQSSPSSCPLCCSGYSQCACHSLYITRRSWLVTGPGEGLTLKTSYMTHMHCPPTTIVNLLQLSLSTSSDHHFCPPPTTTVSLQPPLSSSSDI